MLPFNISPNKEALVNVVRMCNVHTLKRTTTPHARCTLARRSLNGSHDIQDMPSAYLMNCDAFFKLQR